MGRINPGLKDKIIENAAFLFHSKGYDNVGIQEICDKADIKKGSFYHFFESKRDLAVETLEHRFRLADEHVLQQAFRSDLDPRQQITLFFELTLSAEQYLYSEHGYFFGCPFGKLSAEMSGREDAIREKVAEVFERFLSLLEKTIDAGKTADLFDRNLDTPKAAKSILAFYEGLLLLSKTFNDPSVFRSAYKEFVQFLQ